MQPSCGCNQCLREAAFRIELARLTVCKNISSPHKMLPLCGGNRYSLRIFVLISICLWGLCVRRVVSVFQVKRKKIENDGKKAVFLFALFLLYTAPKLSLTYVKRTCQVHIHFPKFSLQTFQIVSNCLQYAAAINYHH